MSSPGVRVTIGTNLNQLRSGLDEAGGMVKEFTHATNRASQQTRHLSEMVGALGLASDGAGKFATNMLGAFASGGVMGLAIGGVTSLIGFLKESKEAAKKLNEELATTGKALDQAKLKTEEMAIALRQGAAAAKQFHDANAIADASREYAAVQEKIEKKQQELNEKKASFVRYLPTEEALEQEILVLLNKKAEAEEKIRQAALQQAQDALEANTAAGQKATEATEKEHEKRVAAAKAADAERLESAKRADQAKMASLKEAMDVEQAEAEGLVLIEKQKAARAIEQQKQTQELARSIEQFMKPVEASVNGVIDGLFDHTRTGAQKVHDAFKKLASGVLQVLVGMVAKKAALAIAERSISAAKNTSEATGAIAVASAEGAKSQAGTPFIGPGLALAAAAMLTAVLTASLLPKISAAGGADLGSLGGVLEYHPREMMLPEHLAERVRNMTEPQQGATLTVQVTAMDTQGVEAALRDNQSAISKVLREMQRNGRL